MSKDNATVNWSPSSRLSVSTGDTVVYTPVTADFGQVVEFTASISVDGCTVSEKISIDVEQAPNARLVALNGTDERAPCSIDTLSAEGSTGVGLEYTWRPAEYLTVAPSNPQQAIFTANRDQEYSVIVTDDYGCRSRAEVTIESLNVFAGDDITTPYCEDVVLSGLADEGILSVEWTGSGTIENSSSLNATLKSSTWDIIPEGETSLTLELFLFGTTTENCVVYDTLLVTGVKPQVDYVIGDATISTCGGSFNGALQGSNATLTWVDTQYFDDPAGDVNSLNPSLTPPESAIGTSRYYRYTLNDVNGCGRVDSVLVEFEEGSDLEISTASTHYATPGVAYHFSDVVVSNGSDDYTYNWTPSDLFTDPTVLNPVITVPANNVVYDIILGVIDNASGCVGRDSLQVISSRDVRIISLTTDKPVGCVGDSAKIDLELVGLGTQPNRDLYHKLWYKVALEDTVLSISEMSQNGYTPLRYDGGVNHNSHFKVIIEEEPYAYVVSVSNEWGENPTDYIVISPSGIVANAGDDIVIGACQTAALDASASEGNGLTYSWTPTDGLVGSTTQVTASYKGPSTTIRLDIEDQYGCTASDDVDITVGVPVEAVVIAAPMQSDCDEVLFAAADSKGEELSYSWSSTTGALSPSYLAATTFKPYNGGQHTINLEVEDKHGCTDIEVITVNADYMIVDAGEDDYINSGESTTLSATVTGSNLATPLSYLWLPLNMTLDAGQPETETSVLTASQRYVLRVADENGCFAFDDKYVFVQGGELTVSIDGNDGPACAGGNVVLLASVTGGNQPYSYLWKDAAGDELGRSGTLNFDVAEETEVFLTVTDASTSITTSTIIEVREVDPPVIVFSGGGEYYSGQTRPSLMLSDTETDVLYGLILDNNEPIDTLTGTGTDKVWESPVDGVYQVYAIRKGLCDNVVSKSDIIIVREVELTDVVIDAFNVSDNGTNMVCKGSTISFEYAVSGGIQDNYDYTWYVDGEIAASGGETQYFDVQQPGSYKLSVTDGYSSDEATIEIEISDVKADAGDDIFIGSCNAATLDASASNGAIDSYSWMSAAGVDLGNSATTAYSGKATSVMLTVADIYGCVSMDTIEIAVADAPVAVSVDTIQAGCSGTSVYASSSTGESLTYGWWATEGEVTPSNFATTTYTPENGGTSLLHLMVTDKYGCTDEKVIVAESSLIKVNAGHDQNIRTGESVLLSGTVTGDNGSYRTSWEPSAGLTNSHALETYTSAIATSTKFTVSVTDDASCTSSDEMTVFVVGVNLTAAIVGGDDEVCVPETTELFALPNGGTGAYEYSWRNSAGDVLGTEPFYVLFATEETEITLMITSGSEIVSVSKTIKVADYDVETIILSGGGDYISASNIPPLVIENTVLGTQYQILRSGAPLRVVTGTGDDYYYDVTGDGTYQVYGYKEGICGYSISNEVEVTKIEVDEVTIASMLGAGSVVCKGTEVTLSADVVGGDDDSYIYQWRSNEKIISTNLTTVLRVSTSGYYTLYVTDGYTEDKDSVFIEVSNVTAEIGDNVAIGACESVLLDASASVGEELTYEWSILSPNITNELMLPHQNRYQGASTPMSVTVTDKYGCTDIDEIYIEVAEPVEAITERNVIIDGCGSIELDGSASKGSSLSYSWSSLFGVVEPSFLANTLYTPLNGGRTKVMFKVEDPFGCSDTMFVNVDASFLHVDAGEVSYIDKNSKIALEANVTGAIGDLQYSWTPTDMVESASSQTTSTVELIESRIYSISVFDNESGCTATDDKYVIVTGGTLTAEIGGYNGPICLGEQLNLTAIINGGTGWSENDGYWIEWRDIDGNVIWHPSSPTLAYTPTRDTRLSLTIVDAGTVATDTIDIKIANSQLTQFNLIGGGDYYYDTNIPSLILDGSEVGVDYVLLKEGSPIDTVAGTGDAIEWSNPADGDYRVLAFKAGSCNTFMTGFTSVRKVVVKPLMINAFNFENDTVCFGTSIDISVEVTGGDANNYKYVWRTDDGFLVGREAVNVTLSQDTKIYFEISDGVSTADTSISIVVISPLANAGADVYVGSCGVATLIGSASTGK